MSNSKQAKGQNETDASRRFIEESFPVKEVGAASSKEKNIRHGHISTLHTWWARRPLAASRATAYAALTPAPKDAEEWQKKRDFIIQLSQWENSNNQSLLERARREILEANGGVPPKVLDPFSGGGSYPLEALRLGCESYANDYNPVAVLIEKATLEYPQKFGRPFEGMPDWARPRAESRKAEDKKKKKGKDEQPALFDSTIASEQTDFNPLLNAVRFWGDWVLEKTRSELEKYYPSEKDGSIPVGYVWARAIFCQNPACRQEIPLIHQYWLSKKKNKKIALYPKVKKGKLEFIIVGDGYNNWPDKFDPDKGTISRSVAICPICNTTVDNETVRRLFNDKQNSEKMLVVVTRNPKKQGKNYRIATNKDFDFYKEAIEKLSKDEKLLSQEWGVEAVPDEPLVRVPMVFGVINVWVYGVNTWGAMFNERQKLALITFIKHIRDLSQKLIVDYQNVEFAQAVVSYIGLVLDRLANYNSSFSLWVSDGEFVAGTFAQGQSIPMRWDFFELSPFSGATGDWKSAQDWVDKTITHLSASSRIPASVRQESATNLSYPENYFDAILTDPPYYDNVPYSYLSDFYYVILKRSLGNTFPELFLTPLTPKKSEIVGYWGEDGTQDPKMYFEDLLKKAFQEIYRILKPNGISVIVYAHKSTAGWETVINALLDSNLVVTSAWPINTERTTRLRASDSAALGSSIYVVVRKIPRKPTGFYNDVRTELQQYLDIKLHRLWEEGIGGADFFISAIGSAIEVFGTYEQVMDFEGNIVRADRLLEEVRSIATNYAVKQILHNGFASEITPMARFYVLWRWNYGEALVPFDEANKLAHSCGLDLSLQFSKNGFIKKEKEFVRMLGPQGRKLDDLDDPRDMIDVMHKSLLLWEKGQRSEMVKALADRGFGKSEAFYRVAQAISETLPLESKEKKLLDGFLAGRDRVQEEVEKSESQGKMF